MKLFTALICLMMLSIPARASDPITEGSTPGLRAYWVDYAPDARHIGQIDWESYDQLTQVEQINWPNSNNTPFVTDGRTDYFAARFVGQIQIPTEGIWTFSLGSDDGSVLYIDGEAIITQPNAQNYRTRMGIVTLSKGAHDFELRYFQGSGNAGLVLEWDGPGMSAKEVVPASAFSSPSAEPVYDPGGEGLWVYWHDNARHASNVGQIDWTNADRVETVQRVSFRRTDGPFRVDGPSDYFAARFHGVINIKEAGTWTFELGSDQSALLLIDGQPVIDDAQGHSFRWRDGQVRLSEGDHIFEVRFWEGYAQASLCVTWQGPSDPFPQVIPSSAFRPGVGAPNPTSGGGLHAYRYDNARHASNVGQIEWADHDSMDTVQNIYYPLTEGAMAAGGPSDYFAMRFVGQIDIPRSGSWTLGLGSDQSARVYIDGAAMVDDTAGHSFRWAYGTKTLQAGKHDIEVQYWEGYADAGLVLTWQGPGDESESVVPASAFSPRDEEPALGTGGQGLRVYWVDNAHHAQKVGHIDWQRYDRITFEANLSWGLTSGRFEGTTIHNQSGISTSPGGPKSDYFGLRAEGLIEIPFDGLWSFGLGSDQSAQLFIDGKLVVNDDQGHPYRWRHGEIELEAGTYRFEVRYWEGYANAGLSVTWTPPGGVEEVIPPSALSHNEIETPYDSGGGGLRAYWTTNARHATNAGQIDWGRHNHATTVPNIAWRLTSTPFDDSTPSDYFGLRLLGQIDIPASGEWTFSLGSDQSAILLIDGEEVVNDVQGHSYRWVSGGVVLTKGKHDIELRYWEGYADAGLHLAWRGPTVPADIIVPRSAFSLRENETPSETGGGLRAYWTTNARHASNAGQIDYAKHSVSTIVDKVSWPITDGPFMVDGASDYFGLRLIGLLDVPETGTWTFSLGSDQSAVLLIDDQPVVVDASGHPYRWRSGTIDLTQGEHKFEVLYWEGYSDAGLHVSWKAPGSGFEEIIPASAFRIYDTEPVYDPGEAALHVDWYNNARGYTLDSLDWDNPTKSTVEPRVSWGLTTSSFTSGIGSDYFALRARGTLVVPESGTWTFRVGSDQYARLYIDDRLVVDDTSGHSMRWMGGSIELGAGEHTLELQYMEGYADAALLLSWQGPDDQFERIIPASAFKPRDKRVKVVQWREVGAQGNR